MALFAEQSLGLTEEERILFKTNDIEVGSWAIFKINNEIVTDQQNPKQFIKTNCLFGLILGFKSFNEKGQIVQCKYKWEKTLVNIKKIYLF